MLYLYKGPSRKYGGVLCFPGYCEKMLVLGDK
jgi:hypothetical protein